MRIAIFLLLYSNVIAKEQDNKNIMKVEYVLFTSHLNMQTVDGLNLFRLTSMLKGVLGASPVSNAFKVPKGFETNLASVPRVFQPFILNDDPDIRKAATLHDYGYGMIGEITPNKFYTRAEVDRILRLGMYEESKLILDRKKNKVSKTISRLTLFVRRWVVWGAVRIGGGFTWTRYIAQGKKSTLMKLDHGN